jgi:hypothetical protein
MLGPTAAPNEKIERTPVGLAEFFQRFVCLQRMTLAGREDNAPMRGRKHGKRLRTFVHGFARVSFILLPEPSSKAQFLETRGVRWSRSKDCVRPGLGGRAIQQSENRKAPHVARAQLFHSVYCTEALNAFIPQADTFACPRRFHCFDSR